MCAFFVPPARIIVLSGQTKAGDNMFILVIRTLILVLVVTVAVRLMGKRTIGELQASELVVTLLISDLAAVPMQEIGAPLLSGVVPIIVLVSAEILISAVLLKNPRLWRLINGTPVIVIKNGRVEQKALRDLRMTNEDLFEGLRKQGIFSISSVKYAIIETDGQMSVLQYAAQLPLTAADAGKTPNEDDIEFLVVSDGDIDQKSLQLTALDETALLRKAASHGAAMNDIFIMTATPDGRVKIIRKEKQ